MADSETELPNSTSDSEFEQRTFDFALDPALLVDVLVAFAGGDMLYAQHVRRRILLAYWWMLPLTYFASAGALLLYDRLWTGGLRLPIQAVLLFAAFPPVLALLYLASPDRHILRWKKDAIKQARSTAALSSGPIRIELTEANVIYSDRWCTVRYGWHAVIALWDGPTAVVLSMANRRLIMIPKSEFKDANDLQPYVILLGDKIKRDGGKDAFIRVLLSDNDAQCPGCRYNLRGAPGRKCPECGRQIDINDIPRQILLFPDSDTRGDAE